MDNAQKAIMIGVGLFITIIIISVVLLITNLGTGLTNDASGTLAGIGTQLEEQLYSRYDKKNVNGAEIISAYDTYGADIDFTVDGRDLTETNKSTSVTTNATYKGAFTAKAGEEKAKLAFTKVN